MINSFVKQNIFRPLFSRLTAGETIISLKNKIDDWLPNTHIRFYDKKKLIRLLDDNNIIFENNWGYSSESFKYNGTNYSFASVVFKS